MPIIVAGIAVLASLVYLIRKSIKESLSDLTTCAIEIVIENKNREKNARLPPDDFEDLILNELAEKMPGHSLYRYRAAVSEAFTICF